MNSAINKFSQFTGLAVAQLYFLCGVITLYEVISRYAFHAPTQWAFEMVMVFCATAWMLSAGYVTLKNRHIGITVFYLMASDRAKWRLDLFALIVGVIALFLLTNDSMGRALDAISNVERAGTAFNSPEPLMLKTALFLGATIYLLQLLANFYRHVSSPAARLAIVVVSTILIGRLVLLLIGHYWEGFILAEWADSAAASVAEGLDLRQLINIRAYDIGTVSIGIVITLLLLMMTGMPLGVVTLIISIVCALLFFGPKGLYLVSTNAFGLLESYPLIAVPLFVLMASILEKAGIAEDLFDAMSIFAGNLRGGVAVQTVVVAVIMAAMSGIMGGEIVMLGLVALPQMLRLGYDRKLSIGTICAGGSLATLIPPSII
ncbi:TRAP transporter large permease subunit, partial [Thalassobaculum salexigens]